MVATAPLEPSRKRPGQLSEEQIVAAAVQIITADGVAGLSMRRLSRELQVSPMAPYYYVADKDGLLDLVVEAVLSDVEVPTDTTQPWDVRLRVLVDRVDEQLRRHPGIARLLLERILAAHRPLLEEMMSLLVDAGFDERGVLMAFSLLHTYLYGRHEVTMLQPPHPGEQLPVIAVMTEHLDEVSGRDYYGFGVDTIIDGLKAQLAKPVPPRPTKRGAARNGRRRATP